MPNKLTHEVFSSSHAAKQVDLRVLPAKDGVAAIRYRNASTVRYLTCQ